MKSVELNIAKSQIYQMKLYYISQALCLNSLDSRLHYSYALDNNEKGMSSVVA